MSDKITKHFQYVNRLWLVPLLALAVSGCADSLDQTNGDISSPATGLVRIGDQLRAEGDNESALQFYANAVSRAPDDAFARKRFADALAAYGDDARAAEQYGALVKLEPGNVDMRCTYGRLLIKLNQPAEAKQQYETVLNNDADNVRALNGLGIALDLLGDHAAAQEKYKTALEQKPDDTATINNLGHSYVMGGAYEPAIKLLEPQGQNPVSSPTLRRNLADAYGMVGMDLDAERLLKIDLPPDQVKKVLAHYKMLHAQGAAPALYADLGAFSTANLADAHNQKIAAQFAKEVEKLAFEVVPEVDEEGGTPIFFARIGGFEQAAELKNFCAKLKKSGEFCKPHSGMSAPGLSAPRASPPPP